MSAINGLSAKTGFKLAITVVLVLPLLVIAGAGCAHSRDAGDTPFMKVVTPKPPLSLSGRAALPRPNASVSAQVKVHPEPSIAQPKPIEGDLLVRGNRLLFA